MFEPLTRGILLRGARGQRLALCEIAVGNLGFSEFGTGLSGGATGVPAGTAGLRLSSRSRYATVTARPGCGKMHASWEVTTPLGRVDAPRDSVRGWPDSPDEGCLSLKLRPDLWTRSGDPSCEVWDPEGCGRAAVMSRCFSRSPAALQALRRTRTLTEVGIRDEPISCN